jgi:hypothetical protein
MVLFSFQGIASKHAVCGTQNLISNKCYLCPRIELLPMSPVWTLTEP